MARMTSDFKMDVINCKTMFLSCPRVRRDDLEDEDDQESYYNYVKNAPIVAYPDDEEELEYDSDGNPIAPEKSKVICTTVLTLSLPRGSPLTSKNRLALDRVKCISSPVGTYGSERVNGDIKF